MEFGFITTGDAKYKGGHSIGPDDITFTDEDPQRLKVSLGKAELETNAARLVLFFQKYGSWRSFTIQELEMFADHARMPDIFGYGLLYALAEDWGDSNSLYPGGLVQVRNDGKLAVTDKFICLCAGKIKK